MRVGVLGDSVARLFYAALLRAVGLSPKQRVVTGHRSFTHSLASGAHGSFVWAPYGENISSALRGWHAAGTAPDIVVAGASLWHMLHVGDGDEYAASLRDVSEALTLLRSDAAPAANRTVGAAKRRHALPPLFFWMSTTALVTHKLPTEEKRARLTPEAVDSYNALARQQRLQLPDGPCVLLDVHRITQGAGCSGCDWLYTRRVHALTHRRCVHGGSGCGPDCTGDGMHFINATYDALVQQWANGVRLMWRAAYCASRGERRALRWRSQTTAAGLCEPPDVSLLHTERRR